MRSKRFGAKAHLLNLLFDVSTISHSTNSTDSTDSIYSSSIYCIDNNIMSASDPNNFMCVVCQEELFDGQQLNATLCGHIYHRLCIRKSLHMELQSHK